MHAVRRSLIAAIETVRVKNTGIAAGAGDRVGLVTFDALDVDHAPQIVRPLNTDWTTSMQGCIDLQAVGDIGESTATEAGIALARQHLQNVVDGGAGRSYANKVIILLTDGVPNAWSMSAADIDGYIAAHPSADYYTPEYLWCNAALVQAHQFREDRGTLFVVGMGLGADYDFLDRMARLAETDLGGLSVRGSGNPAEYEQRLTDIMEEIVKNPGSRLVD
jgi:hypothetical protein